MCISARRSAFTLIELLVIISIVALLSAMLFPAFARTRENAHRVSCQLHLKELGMAFLQYAQDYDEHLPTRPFPKTMGWVYFTSVARFGNTRRVFQTEKGSLYPYVKNTQLYICPSDRLGAISGNSYGVSNCMPSAFMADFGSSSLYVLLAEESPNRQGSYSSTDDAYIHATRNFIANRHFGGSNVLFLDGHVRSMTTSPMAPAQSVFPKGIKFGGVSGCTG
jgi:prepilin-type processing-associated H-X9-DG protein